MNKSKSLKVTRFKLSNGEDVVGYNDRYCYVPKYDYVIDLNTFRIEKTYTPTKSTIPFIIHEAVNNER